MATKKDPKAEAFKHAMAARKLQAAERAGLSDKVNTVGWKNMTAAECGKIGGLMGGKIGGQMIRRMLAMVDKASVSQDKAE